MKVRLFKKLCIWRDAVFGEGGHRTQGTVAVTWAGRTQNMPLAVQATAAACDPVFTLAAAPGVCA